MSKTALLFAGQGAQSVGMGKDLAGEFPAVRSLFERGNQVLGYDLSRLCFEGPESELTQTEHAQPGIYLVGWAAFSLLKEQVPGLRFDATAGLSLGEFTALAAAGALRFEDGLRLVRQRGLFMQEACDNTEGGMAAIIGLDEATTQAVCDESGAELANLNCPGQIVISGTVGAIENACEAAREKGAKRALPLKVAGAYHSSLMTSAREKLDAELAGVAIQAPSVPVISNVTAEPHGGPAEIGANLVAQVTSPVRWETSIRRLLADGFTRFIELGPGTALSGFMKRIGPGATVMNVANLPSLQQTVEQLSTSA